MCVSSTLQELCQLHYRNRGIWGHGSCISINHATFYVWFQYRHKLCQYKYYMHASIIPCNYYTGTHYACVTFV